MSSAVSMPGPGQTDADREILRKRAEIIARPLAGEDAGGEDLLVIEFILAGERYALDAEFVQEVAPVREITPLPGTPDFILGIINLRGAIRSVVDLRRVFGEASGGPGERGFAVILDDGDMEFGLYAEEVPGARALRPGTLAETLPTFTDVRADFLKGVTPDGMAYLDAARLLSDGRLTLGGAKQARW